MLKIPRARPQHYMNQELQDVQAGFGKGRETKDQIANIHWIIDKANKLKKKSSSISLTTLKHLTVWITTNGGKFFKRWKIPDNLIFLLRNLYAGQKQQNGHGATDWFIIRKGVFQGYILSPCLFNLHAECM